MNTGDLAVKGELKAGVWQRIYSSGELAASVSSISITGLNGDSDKVYKVVSKLNTTAAAVVLMHFNTDSAANYGNQYLHAHGNQMLAARSTAETGVVVASQSSSGIASSLTETIIYAKSGTGRTALVCFGSGMSSNYVTRLYEIGYVWNETSANLVSLLLDTGVMDSTSSVDVYRRVDAS